MAARARRRGTRSSTRSHDPSKASASDRSLLGSTPAAWSRRIVRSRSGSSSSSSRTRVQRRSNATAEDTSSSTSTLGGSCASTGCSDRRRCAKEWSVPMAAPSSWPRATRQRSASSAGVVGAICRSWSSRRTRSRSSAPAFSVKVMAARLRSSTAPGRDQGDDATDERGGLARPGAGLHEERGVEVGRDALRGRAWSGGAAVMPTPPRRGARPGRHSAPARGRGACGPTACGSSAVPRPSGLHVWQADAGVGGGGLGVGREHTALDAVDDLAQHLAGAVEHLVGDGVADAVELAWRGDEPVLGLHGDGGVLHGEPAGQPVEGELELGAAARRGRRRRAARSRASSPVL